SNSRPSLGAREGRVATPQRYDAGQEHWPMTQPRHLRTLTEFVSLPTAPFCEQACIEYIRRFVSARMRLSLTADHFGNMLVRYRGPGARRSARPVVLAGHLDHPGFVARLTRGLVVDADFRGWVDRSYFPGAAVRFFTADGAITGKVVSVDGGRPSSRGNADRRAQPFRHEKPPERAFIRVKRPVPPGSIGMWDIPGYGIRKGVLNARACDDVAGVAAILCTLDELCRRRAPGQLLA